MKKKSISFDQFRRQLRRELFLKRLQDNDHSEARLYYDARKLDTLLIANGYKLPYKTEWAVHFDEKRHSKRIEDFSRSPLKVSQTDSNLKSIAEAEND